MVKPKTTIQQEEELSEEVSKYFCFYDKSNGGCRERQKS